MKYITIDNSPKIQIFGMLAALFIPFFGPAWYGTKFTSIYSEVRLANGTWVIMMLMIHLGILFYIIFN